MAEVKWIKLSTDLFDNRKIKHIRKLPEGNNILLIWIFLLTLAGRCNSGGMIFLTENIPYTIEMLAAESDFEVSTVKLALEALEHFGMISTSPLLIEDWNNHQNVDGMEKIREQNRLRKQRQRENQKALPDGNVTSHVTVTQCHATDIDKEEDKEKKEIKKKNIYSDIPELNDALLSFIDFRKKIKKPMTDRAITLLTINLAQLSTDPQEQVAILNQSILNGWVGVFPLHQEQRKAEQSGNVFMDMLKERGGGQ